MVKHLRVLLTSTNWWPAAARLAIVMAHSGCEVSVLCRPGHPVSKTRVSHRILRYSGLRPLESLRLAIATCSPDLIVPCDDLALLHLHEIHDGASPSVKALLASSLGPAESYSTVSSRTELLRVARELGLRVPDFARVRASSDLDLFAGRHACPWVLKIDGANGGDGVRIVRSLREARESFWSMAKPRGAALALKRLIVNHDPFSIRPWIRKSPGIVTVQEFIHGRPANCAVACVRGEVLAGMAVEVIAAISDTEASCVVRVVDNEEMMHIAREVCSHLGLSGFHGFDFMIENHTHHACLIELNARYTSPCILQLGDKPDVVSALCAHLSGKKSASRQPGITKDVVAYFPQASRYFPNSTLLQSSHHDIPSGEPELTRELSLPPWPDRSLLARVYNYLRDSKAGSPESRAVVFPEALADSEPASFALQEIDTAPQLPETQAP